MTMTSGRIRVSQTDWLRKLTQLNKARDNAPHKPLMLLVFLDMVEKGEYVGGDLPLTGELAYRFDTYFGVARHRRSARPDVRMPFHHLSTQKFWSPRTIAGDISKHRSTTVYVVPDAEFAEACRDAKFRHQARCVLIENHFEPAERNALYHLIGMEIPATDEIARNACFETANDAENEGRSARFRLDIVSAYNYTCALTGYRVTTIAAGAIVDAAHIHQFSDSRNNDPNNGIALCKNAHWQFDAGLWTIDDDYRVVVARDAFSEASPNQKPLSEMDGQRLLLPGNEIIWPSRVHLAWHRAKKFRLSD
jgi:putative restriction endonuclease